MTFMTDQGRVKLIQITLELYILDNTIKVILSWSVNLLTPFPQQAWYFIGSTTSRLPERDKHEALPYQVNLHSDLSLCWLYRSHCRFCLVPAHFCGQAGIQTCKPWISSQMCYPLHQGVCWDKQTKRLSCKGSF